MSINKIIGEGMLVYKVLNNINGRLFSANQINSFISSPYRMEYFENQVTLPLDNSMLFAFLNLGEAKRFADSFFQRMDIHKAYTPCYIENVIPQESYYLFKYNDKFSKFWNNILEDASDKNKEGEFPVEEFIGQYKIYTSSVCCPSLKILEPIWSNYGLL